MNARARLAARRWWRVLLPVLAASALVLGGVAADAAQGHPSSTRAARKASAAGQAGAATCHPKASSLSPTGPPALSSGPTVASIRARGYLVAGVDQSTYPFGFLKPASNQIVGFDVDMINAVAKAIFGNKPNDVRLLAISDGQRTKYLESGRVDIVAHTMTITCARLKQVDFSSVYFDAQQRVLVLQSSKARSLADLKGQKVCATTTSTSLAVLEADKTVVPVPVTYWTDCLVLLQQGDVAAISTDNCILAGLKAQDPWTKLIGPSLADNPYGLAISNQHPDFVRFVNAVLQQMKTDGQWAASYRKWIGTPAPPPPPAEYRD